MMSYFSYQSMPVPQADLGSSTLNGDIEFLRAVLQRTNVVLQRTNMNTKHEIHLRVLANAKRVLRGYENG